MAKKERKFVLKEPGVFDLIETAERTDTVDVGNALEFLYKMRAELAGYKKQRIQLIDSMNNTIETYNKMVSELESLEIEEIDVAEFHSGKVDYQDTLTKIIWVKINLLGLKNNFEALAKRIEDGVNGYNHSIDLMNEANNKLEMGVEWIPEKFDEADLLDMTKEDDKK